MKIFVAYGYNDRDRWIETLVFPIIRAFGDEVVTGEELQGDQITDAVRRKIQGSDALVAFVTRRDEISSGRWTTHRWVTDELAHALALGRPVVEVREAGVDDQGGIGGDRQRIVYDESQRDRCLVELVKTLGRWHQARDVQLKLLPETFAQAVFPLLRNPRLRCTYRLLVDGEETEDFPTRILPITGGLFIRVRGVPPEALLQVHVECEGRSWTSSYESTDALSIAMRED
jgi:hypothetical protein